MKKLAVGSLIAMTALLLAGCSSDTSAPESSASPVASQAAQESATVSPETSNFGSVADYKSVAQPFVADIEESIEKFDEYHCFNFPDAFEENLCNATIVSAGMRAKTVSIALRGAMKPGVPAYIGDLPAELQNVMDKTLDAADEASSVAEEWSDEECPSGSTCRALNIKTPNAFDGLHDELVTWSNY